MNDCIGRALQGRPNNNVVWGEENGIKQKLPREGKDNKDVDWHQTK